MTDDTPFGITAYHSFFMQYGQFLAAWNSFEVLIEIALKRELKMDTKTTCIVFSSIGFAAKSHILGALLNQAGGGSAKYKLIQAAITHAERNGFAHGFISVSPNSKLFTMVRREVKGQLSVKPKEFTSLTMQKHLYVFGNMMVEAQDAFNITDNDLIKYQREVELLAKAPPAQGSPHPAIKTNSPAPSKSLRKQYRARILAEKRKDGK